MQELTITQNGTYTAPEGTAYSPINVNVPSKEEETKSITITENGTTTVLPTSGKVLSKVDIVANVPQTSTDTLLKDFLAVRNAKSLFSSITITDSQLESILKEKDTSACTDMTYMFSNCSNLTTIPQLDTSNVTNMTTMFYSCSNLTTIPLLNTSKVTNMGYMFDDCYKLIYLKLLNVKTSLQIGSGTRYGHLLEKDCLIQIISELIDTGSSKTLTMGTANKEKIADTYVKLLADDGTGKHPFEVCESTDEGAMPIEAYCNSKNWTLA